MFCFIVLVFFFFFFFLFNNTTSSPLSGAYLYSYLHPSHPTPTNSFKLRGCTIKTGVADGKKYILEVLLPNDPAKRLLLGAKYSTEQKVGGRGGGLGGGFFYLMGNLNLYFLKHYSNIYIFLSFFLSFLLL